MKGREYRIISCLLVLIASPALGYFRGVPVSQFPSTFTANPNVSISVINTGGGIVCSNTSGQVPMFLQCSASAITATGTSKPFEDLEYVWNFGDTSGVENFTRPTDGATINANNGQITPEAAYVYRNVGTGTYTVTLNIRGCAVPSTSNSGQCSSYTTASITTPITVSAFNKTGGEAWADSNAGGTNAGTQANPYNTLAAINTFIGTGSNKALHVAQNSVFTGELGPWENSGSSVSGMRIDTYVGSGGAGASPIFQQTSGTSPALNITNSTPTAKSDLVISGITFENSGTNNLNTNGIVNLLAPTGKTFTNFYLDNVTISSTITSASQNGATVQGQSLIGLNQSGFWNVTINTPTSVSSSVDSIGIFSGVQNWSFFVGLSITGGTGSSDTIRNHHIYPDVQHHGLFEYINFGSGPNRNFCINGNNGVGSQTPPPPVAVGQWSITDNNCTGVERSFDTSNANNEAITVQYTDVVIQRNAINNLTGDGYRNFYSAASVTERDNRLWNNTANAWYDPDPGLGGLLGAQLYRNKIYVASGTIFGATISFTNGSNTFTFGVGSSSITPGSSPTGMSQDNYPVGLQVTCSGSPPSPFVAGTPYYVNSASASGGVATITLSTTPNGTTVGPASANGSATCTTKWTAGETVAYNQIVDARASNPFMIDWGFSDQAAASSFVDYNQYYSTALQTNLFNNLGTGQTFAQWQTAGFDAHGSVANPGWNTPITQWSDFGP